MPYIFSSTQVTKSQVYTRIKELITAAGWTNVSSNAATDFDVFKSTGKDGTKNLVFQMRATDRNNANNVETTSSVSSTNLSVRLIAGYTPGAPGVAGTFTKNPTWWNMPISPYNTAVPGDVLLTIWYYIDKNMIAIVVETPLSMNLSPCIFFLGIPDETYCSEPGSVGLIYAPGFTWQNWGATANTFLTTDNPGELSALASTANDGTGLFYTSLPPNSPNSAGKFIPGDMYYGNATYGVRGKFPCFHSLPNNGSLLNRDIIQQETTSYKIFIIPNIVGISNLDSLTARTPYPTNLLAIQLS